MAKKQKLTPVPEPAAEAPKKASRRKAVAEPPPPPDLSHIADGLRALAVPIGDIDFDPANARKHPEKNLNAIRASLRAYGQRRPLVVNRRTGLTEAGNGTLQCALALGWTHVAVLYVDDDPTTAAGYAIADNRTAELADWDKEALDALLRTVQAQDEDLAAMLSELAKDEGLIPEEPAAGDDPGGAEPAAQFEVLTKCKNEAQQKELFEELTNRGLECKVLSL